MSPADFDSKQPALVKEKVKIFSYKESYVIFADTLQFHSAPDLLETCSSLCLYLPEAAATKSVIIDSV